MSNTAKPPADAGVDAGRRRLFKAAGAAVIPLSALGAADAAPAPAAAPRTYLFFNASEAAFVKAAIARLIPDEPHSPGALGAEVQWYIDGQLAGAWGNGLQLYSQGPFKQGTASQGYQHPFVPAQIYRLGIQGLNKALGTKIFSERPAAEQDEILARLEEGRIDIGPIPAALLFSTLLQNTVEGYFSDPAYGGNKGMAGWKLLGFPGAYAAYADWVDQHNLPFRLPPISMSQVVPHDMPGMPHDAPSS